jgi:hypothetical protein
MEGEAIERVELVKVAMPADRRARSSITSSTPIVLTLAHASRQRRWGWRLQWRYKSRPGRPPIPLELRRLIRRVATGNPLWGEERIANELLLKLAIRVSPRTVRKYMPSGRRIAHAAINAGRPFCATTHGGLWLATSLSLSRRRSDCCMFRC